MRSGLLKRADSYRSRQDPALSGFFLGLGTLKLKFDDSYLWLNSAKQPSTNLPEETFGGAKCMLIAFNNMVACEDTSMAHLILTRSDFVATPSFSKVLICCVLPLLYVAGNATADAYKCNVNGRTEYSDQPCAQSSKPTLRPATAAPERQPNAAEIQAQFEREVAEERKKKEAIAAETVITNEHICKAGIAKIMGRDPKTIKVLRNESGIVHLQYRRTNDGSLWSNRCRIDGSRIMWASDKGRWRDDPRDEKLAFAVAADTITVKETFTDGSSTQQAFKASQLR